MFISYEELRCSHTAWLYGVYKCRGHASYCVNVLIWNRCMPKYLFRFILSLTLSVHFDFVRKIAGIMFYWLIGRKQLIALSV